MQRSKHAIVLYDEDFNRLTHSQAVPKKASQKKKPLRGILKKRNFPRKEAEWGYISYGTIL